MENSICVDCLQEQCICAEKQEKPKPKRNRDKSIRPSPPISATEYPLGFEALGNNGLIYVVGADKNGIHRWVKKK